MREPLMAAKEVAVKYWAGWNSMDFRENLPRVLLCLNSKAPLTSHAAFSFSLSGNGGDHVYLAGVTMETL